MDNTNTNRCAFTICTGSYRGLGEALKNSFLKYNPQYTFYIFFTDKVTLEGENNLLCDEAFKEFDALINLNNLKFKYDVVEYATCAKPFCFHYLFSLGYEQALYFDPDILFFSKFEEVNNRNSSIFLTPHILSIPCNDENVINEEAFLRYGTYNCGFVGFNNKVDSCKVVEWWAKRLIDRSFASADVAYYTDQKWMDFIPSFLETTHVNIIKNIGCNFASWNFYERDVVVKNNQFYIKSRPFVECEETPLVFMHFSGYKFRELLSQEKLFIPKELNQYKNVNPIIQAYKDALNEVDTLSYMNIKYSYSSYSNGDEISVFHRRIFNSLLTRGFNYDDPFACNISSFYMLLKKNHFLLKEGSSYRPVLEDCNDIGSNDGPKRKTRRLSPFFRFMFRVLGEQKYATLLNILRPYLIYDNNVFLLKNIGGNVSNDN